MLAVYWQIGSKFEQIFTTNP